ncbi:MAG: BolA family protein [Pseudomonadota bacterium]|nr:BolA family protein [Pseudomonadota bacterium]
MAVVDTIIKKLEERFAPERLDVLDESHRHRGHAGAKPGGETHFRVKITSAEFDGLTRIERHRLINDCLAEELAGPIHALNLRARTPYEDKDNF